MNIHGYAALSATTPLVPHTFTRRDPRPDDVVIDILYCGVCRSDIHQARNEWRNSIFPMVPGHEIVDKVSGIAETQEMLDFCANHGIICDVEMLDIKNINGAYERMFKSDVRYRFVIDLASLRNA